MRALQADVGDDQQVPEFAWAAPHPLLLTARTEVVVAANLDARQRGLRPPSSASVQASSHRRHPTQRVASATSSPSDFSTMTDSWAQPMRAAKPAPVRLASEPAATAMNPRRPGLSPILSPSPIVVASR